jgi:cystathionine beta-lyase/cystathionine gamma-synthase
VLYSTTKYIGGHSDLIGGAVCVDNKEIAEKIRYVQFAQGAIPSPFECFLLHRSLKTLAVRMYKHQDNAHHVLEF